MQRVGLALLGLALAAGVCVAGPVTISEVLYDAEGSDQGRTFVELFGVGGMSLTGYVLEGINGSGGAITHSVSLTGMNIPEDGFLVLADLDSSGASEVSNLDIGIPSLDLQNGPDSIRLRFGALVVDALGYGQFGGGLLFAGEGDPAPDAPPGSSLARWSAAMDTGFNSKDFHVDATPTPGYEDPLPSAVPTPEPSSALLMLSGLLMLRLAMRHYRGKL